MNTALVKSNGPQTALQRLNAAIERVQQRQIIPPTSGSTLPARGFTSLTVEPIELPRICALYVKPQVARYLPFDGRLEYARSIPVTDHLFQGVYEGNQDTRIFHPDDLGFERCAWCGAADDHWKGAIHCLECGRWLCFGTTVRNFFTCPCGHKGYLQPKATMSKGIVPRWRSGSAGS